MPDAAGQAIERAADPPQQVARSTSRWSRRCAGRARTPGPAARRRRPRGRRPCSTRRRRPRWRGRTPAAAASGRWRTRRGHAGSRTMVAFFSPSTSGAADPRLRGRHQREPEAGQMRRQHRHRHQQAAQAAQPRVHAASCRRRTLSRGRRFRRSGRRRPADRARQRGSAATSSMAIGCVGVSTQRGQIITGSRSTSAWIIWNDRLPAPMTIEARNSMTGTPLARRTSPGFGAAPQMRRRATPASSARPPR